MSENKKQNYLKGAAILAATVAIVKIIGAVYKIPLYNLLGDEGTTHFQVTYTIYNLLLTISTAGIPVALSRLISSSYAVGGTRQIKRYFNTGLVAFSVVGIVGMLIMLLIPEKLANLMGDPEVVNGVRALAPAVLFVCIISVYRGYSQGLSNMMPTAISQILEVLCKLIFGISIAWWFALNGYNSATISAGAIVGVTIGLGLAVPVLILNKHHMAKKSNLVSMPLDTPNSISYTLKQIFKITIPITLSASILNIITLIDTKLVLLRLQSGADFSYHTAKILYGVYSKGLSLFSMPSAFIVPLTVSVVPAIAAAIARNNKKEAKSIMESSLKMTNLLALPAGVGLFVLATPIFNVLYPNSNEMGPSLLAVLGLASYFVCTYLMTSAILQASGHERLTLLTLPLGGAIKICINWVLVGNPNINISGAPIGTLICYVFITIMNVVFIIWKVREHPSFLKIFIQPIFCTGIMGVAAYASYGLFGKIGGGTFTETRMGLLLSMTGAIVISVIVYGILIVATKTVTREDMRLLPKSEKLARLLRIK